MDLTPDEVRAAAETHKELGPDYQSAVIESFLDKVGTEIEARVDARLMEVGRFRPASSAASMALAIVSMAFGIPLTAIVLAVGSSQDGLAGLVVVWAAIAVINVTYSLRSRPQPRRR